MTSSLFARDAAGTFERWSNGAAQYAVDHQPASSAAPLVLAVRCRLAGVKSDDLALLDTGAAWSIIGGEMVDDVIGEASDLGESIWMSSRLGRCAGRLYRMSITLVADEGEDLLVDGTVLLARDWEGPIVLGYHGFLQRVRIALDPGIANSEERWLHFGGAR